MKKWLARLLFVAAIVVGMLAVGHFDGNSPDWASLVVSLSVVLASFYIYEAFKPIKPSPPADGLRTETDDTTVGTSEWQEELQANAQSIRAAMLTCHEHENSKIRIVRPDNRALIAHREKGGWTLRTADIDAKVDAIGVRHWEGMDLEPVKFNWLKIFGSSLDGDSFGNQDTEDVLNLFADGKEEPNFLAWRKVEHRN